MDDHRAFVWQTRLEKVKKALKKNNMQAFIVQAKEEVVPLIKTLVPEGAVVSKGGSMTLAACGVVDFLRSGVYEYLDRDAADVDKHAVQRSAFSADAYFASVNAITETGEILEMDGSGNRVAAITYGPDSVILIAGHNKIVETLEDARHRNAYVAAPTNCHRLALETPCATTGHCSDCKSPARICCFELVLHRQLRKGRIKVILVAEELGY